MDTLIIQIPKQTIELWLFELFDAVFTLVSPFFIIALIIGIFIQLYDIKRNYKYSKVEDINTDNFYNKQLKKSIQKVIKYTITVTILLLFGYNYFENNIIKDYKKQNQIQNIPLTDVQELIHVESNNVTIDPIINKNNNYTYKNKKYNNAEQQKFKIEHDEFFNTYKLIDKDDNKIEISKEEYLMLKNKEGAK
jgi:hypothetical protein